MINNLRQSGSQLYAIRARGVSVSGLETNHKSTRSAARVKIGGLGWAHSLVGVKKKKARTAYF